MEELKQLLDDPKTSVFRRLVGASEAEKGVGKLGDSCYALYEHLMLTNLHVNAVEKASSFFEILKKKFPDSLRVKKLEGYLLEVKSTSQASKFYVSEENEVFLKRQICMSISNGKEKEALSLLSTHLQTFQSDLDAWVLSGKLYASRGDISAACFCFEEALLLKPSNANFYLYLAEAMLSKENNKNDDRIQARKYFSQSLALKKTDLRANFDLFLVTQDIVKDELNADLKAFAKTNIETILAKSNPKISAIAQKVLASISK